MHSSTIPEPDNSASNSTQFVPELDANEIKVLQHETAKQLNLPPFFADDLKIGGKGPELAIIPTGQYVMGSNRDEFGH